MRREQDGRRETGKIIDLTVLVFDLFISMTFIITTGNFSCASEQILIEDSGLRIQNENIEDVLEAISSQTPPYLYTSYQRSIECRATIHTQPQTVPELQEIVRFARDKQLHVKAVGSLHSITDCICTDGIVVNMSQFKQFSFDKQTKFATAGAGLEFHEFLELLHAKNRGLMSTPTYGGITLGGAVGTGAHGTNLKEPTSLSDHLISVRFVDGKGNKREMNDKDEDFKAFRVNLGLLGIIYELTFKTREQYKLEIRNFPMDEDKLLWKAGEIMKMAQANDFFLFFWFPTNKQVVLSVGNRVPVDAPGNCETHLISELSFANSNGISAGLELMQTTGNQVGYFAVQSYSKLGTYQEVPGRSPYFTKEDHCSSCLPKAVGFSHRMMNNRCKECAWKQGNFSLMPEEGAVAIDVKELPAALKTLKNIFHSRLVGWPLLGILFRFINESDSYMGMSSNRASVAIEWVNVPRRDRTQPKMGIAVFQAIGQALIENHGGRPHWGKNGLYYSNPKIIHKAYPKIKDFIRVMEKMDPDELFMNDFGKRIKHKSNNMTMSKAAQKRCALNEACLCQKDSDCGDGVGLLDNVCGKFMGFKVCRNQFRDVNDAVQRVVINSQVGLGLANDIRFVMGALKPFDCIRDFECRL